MKRLLFTILLTAGSLLAAVAQPVQGARPDKERFAHPTNADRIYMLQHSTRGNLEALIDNLSAAGFKDFLESLTKVLYFSPLGVVYL